MANAIPDELISFYVHKEQMLDDVARRYPAKHYVMADDKLRILTAMKAQWAEGMTSVVIRQGHYAFDPAISAEPAADITLERIGEFLRCDPSSFGAAL